MELSLICRECGNGMFSKFRAKFWHVCLCVGRDIVKTISSVKSEVKYELLVQAERYSRKDVVGANASMEQGADILGKCNWNWLLLESK